MAFLKGCFQHLPQNLKIAQSQKMTHNQSHIISDKRNIYTKLNLSDHYKTNATFFTKYNQQNEINELQCLNRLKFILRLYQNWITAKASDEEEIIDIYDIISMELSSNYTINAFLKDFRYIVSQNRDIVAKYDEDESFECDIESCYVQTRLNRDKGVFANTDKRRQLFFALKLIRPGICFGIAITGVATKTRTKDYGWED